MNVHLGQSMNVHLGQGMNVHLCQGMNVHLGQGMNVQASITNSSAGYLLGIIKILRCVNIIFIL
jgi:hypothetical protein